MSNEEDIREAVDAAKAPGSFNIIDVLQDRNYPQTETVIHLDEHAAYEASVVTEKIEELDVFETMITLIIICSVKCCPPPSLRWQIDFHIKRRDIFCSPSCPSMDSLHYLPTLLHPFCTR